MRGIIFAFFGGAFITLQGVANTEISKHIGTWQAAALTQLTGFITALILYLIIRDGTPRAFKEVRPMYLTGGAFGALIIFSNVQAIIYSNVTFSTSVILIAQLGSVFLIETNGWFGVAKIKMGTPQFVGIVLMVAGIVLLGI